jgi:hypothetical protein
VNIILNVLRYIIINIRYHLFTGDLQLHTLNHVYKAFSAAALRLLQSMVHVILFPVLDVLLFYITGPAF